MSREILAIIALALAASASPVAKTANSTAVSTPTATDARVGWVPADGRRSTMGIIWSCLSVFLLCSWKCLHLNLPTPAESDAGWHKFTLWSLRVPYWPERPLLAKWRRNVLWMATICVAPELGVGLALVQWLDARHDLRQLKKDSPERADNYSMAHAFCASMGGITICRPTPTSSSRSEFMTRAAATHVGRPLANPAPITTKNTTTPLMDYRRYYVCSMKSLAASGACPGVSEADIQERSKSDALTKILALLQSPWLVIQRLARATRGLAITQLELATMAFVLCAAAMYIWWWDKPFRMERRFILTAGDAFVPAEGPVCEPEDRVTEWWSNTVGMVFSIDSEILLGGNIEAILPALAYCLSGVAFSAVHLVAWNWAFPSPLTQGLWRSFAMTAFTTSLFPLLVITLRLMDDLPRRYSLVAEVYRAVHMTLMILMAFSYCVSRLAILILTFYCFTSMPATVYEPLDWAAFIPHVS